MEEISRVHSIPLGIDLIVDDDSVLILFRGRF
jgi:hypothetical protein